MSWFHNVPSHSREGCEIKILQGYNVGVQYHIIRTDLSHPAELVCHNRSLLYAEYQKIDLG